MRLVKRDSMEEVWNIISELLNRMDKLESGLGQQINGSMSKPVPPIPPLPGHPRFKFEEGEYTDGEYHQFRISDSDGSLMWLSIEGLDFHDLEACCCIARCWWLDESKKVFQRQTQTTSPGLLTPEYQKCASNAQAWTDYLKARQTS